MNICILRNFYFQITRDFSNYQFLAFRRLSAREKEFFQKHNIHRCYLPELNDLQQKEFYGNFDSFWGEVSCRFPSDHFFWRNVVSSKMQEWESSIAYLMLVLFTLKTIDSKNLRLIILCGSLEEERLWQKWAVLCGWSFEGSSDRHLRWDCGLCQSGLNFLFFLRLVVRNVRKKIFSLKPKFPSPKKHGKTNILVTSLFYERSFYKGEFKDPFFGDLYEYLSLKGQCLVFLSDLLDVPSSGVVRKNQECKRVFLNMPHSLLSWGAMLVVFLRIGLRKIRLQPVHFIGCDFSEVIYQKARDFRYDFTLSAEIYYQAIKRIYREFKFDEVLLIYEGNVFERACIQACREISGAKVCGYNHGVVFPLNLKLRVTDLEIPHRPEPDQLVCTGPLSKKVFLAARNVTGEIVKEGCSLRAIPFVNMESQQRSESRKILLALDGVFSTASVLDWMIEHRECFKDYNLVLRAHPNVPVKDVLKRCVEVMPDYFCFSSGSLENDIKDSFCVFYRHTSVGIQALMNGIPAVHLAIQSPLSGDPIKDFADGKMSIYRGKDIERVLKQVEQLRKRGINKKSLYDLVGGYLASPTSELMDEFIA